jgi:hypothetical protein
MASLFLGRQCIYSESNPNNPPHGDVGSLLFRFLLHIWLACGVIRLTPSGDVGGNSVICLTAVKYALKQVKCKPIVRERRIEINRTGSFVTAPPRVS